MTNKILLDTNAYLRLAEPLHPLLGNQTRDSKFKLQIIHDLNTEVKKDPRFKTRFPWFSIPQYETNRQFTVIIPRNKIKEIENAELHLWRFKKENNLNTSSIDIKCLAIALVLEITLVTDDSDMFIIAKEYEIDAIKTIELLKNLVSVNDLYEENVEQILDYWLEKNDLPKDIIKDCINLFGKRWNL